ncbi:uncharacterized protein LOC142359899, partial [Opisthocomus hoazin]|uniref:uncharacterized protein LOC142359899 n=1 Tax=Opisthocomus hoazin TaxID=30419 RepID=UPI003F530861
RTWRRRRCWRCWGGERAEAGSLLLYGRGQPRPAPPTPARRPIGGGPGPEAEPDGGGRRREGGTLSDVIWDLVEGGDEVEALLVLSPEPELPGAEPALACLRSRQLRPLRFVNVTPRPSPVHCDWRSDTLTLAGFDESVLRLMAAGDPAQLLAEVEASPARYGLAPPPAPPPDPPAGDAQPPPAPPRPQPMALRAALPVVDAARHGGGAGGAGAGGPPPAAGAGRGAGGGAAGGGSPLGRGRPRPPQEGGAVPGGGAAQ